MGGNEGRGVGGSYTAPIDNTATEKKRIPPTGGETNQNGGGYHPHQWKKKKENEAVCGMHAASLISQEEGLWAE